jgi:hypothetical protein
VTQPQWIPANDLRTDVVFKREGQKVTMVEPDYWPAELCIADELLENADPRYVSQGDGMVRFTASNGTALYGFDRQDETRRRLSWWRLIKGDLVPERGVP